MKHESFIQQLPEQCQHVSIKPRHKIALEPIFNNEGVFVVLLTDMPGDCDKFWSLSWAEWKEIEPKHETKLRWIRENLKPQIRGEFNPERYKQLFLF